MVHIRLQREMFRCLRGIEVKPSSLALNSHICGMWWPTIQQHNHKADTNSKICPQVHHRFKQQIFVCIKKIKETVRNLSCSCYRKSHYRPRGSRYKLLNRIYASCLEARLRLHYIENVSVIMLNLNKNAEDSRMVVWLI